MARRATYIKDHTSTDDQLLILDSGDFVGGRGEIYEIKTKYLLRGYSSLRYDAINLGERDFLLGTKFLLAMKQKHDLPLISANVFYPDSVTLFTEPYVIKKLYGLKRGDKKIQPLKVGIFGVIMKRSTLIYKEDEPRLIVKDPIRIANQIVNELQEKCDIIIALAHLTLDQINELATEVNGLDVIIGSHEYSISSEPIWINDIIVIQGGTKGQYIGDLLVNLDNNKKIESFDGKMVRLDKQIKDDPSFIKIVSDYDNAYKKLVKKQPTLR